MEFAAICRDLPRFAAICRDSPLDWIAKVLWSGLLIGGMDRPVPIDQFEKGATLADDQTSYFIIGHQEKLSFGAKTTVQCRVKQIMIALKLSKNYHC